MADPEQDNWNDRWSGVVNHAWTDDSFKKRLLADPKAALQEHGVEMQSNVKVRVMEDTDAVVHLTLPAKPTGELDEKALEQVAGGALSYLALRYYVSPWIRTLRFMPAPPS